MTRTPAAGNSSRRRALRALAGSVLGLALARPGRGRDEGVAVAAQEQAARGGCVRVDRPCKRDGQCCSGLRKRRKGKETCRAHGTGTCGPGQDTCREGMQIACNGSDACTCFVTTGGAGFCGVEGACSGCRTDRDCRGKGFGPDTACVVCREPCANGTACLRPCAGP